MFNKGDFHIHTTFSDGDNTPEEVMFLAKKNGVDILSITDHNTVNGIDLAKNLGKQQGIYVIPGVELSTRFKGKKIHILGYFREEDYKEDNLKEALSYVKSHDVKSLEKKFKNEFDVIKDEYANRISVVTGIELLKFFRATVVLAHPVKIDKEYLHEILKLNFQGLEGKYFKNTVEETDMFIEIAKNKGWIYTAGSDFHTTRRKDKRHGMVGEVYLNEEEIEKFLKKVNNI